MPSPVESFLEVYEGLVEVLLVLAQCQPVAVPELPNDQPHQPSEQGHAEDHTEQVEATSIEDHC